MKKLKYLFLFIFALFLFKPFDSYAIDYGQIGVQFSDESGNVIDELTSTLDRTINVKNVKYILMYTSTNTIKGNSYNLYYDWAIGYSNLNYPIALNVSNMLEEKQEIQHDSRIFVVENYQSSSSEYYVRFHMNSDFTSTATNAWNQVTITLAEPMDLTFYSVYNKQLKKTGGDNSEDITSNTDKVIENQNQNTDKVIENQDQNTQDIINNNNENTDKIIDSNNKTQDVIKDQFNTCTDGYNLFDSEDWYNTYHNAPYCANCMQKEVFDDVEYYSLKTGCYGFDKIEYMTGQFKENTQYTLSFIAKNYPGFSTGDLVRITYSDGRKTFIPINSLNERFYKFTNPTNTTIKSIGFTYTNNARSLIRNIELDEGTTPKPYQKYGEKICTNKIDETNDKLDNIDNTLTNDDVSEAQSNASDFFKDFNENSHGLTGVVTAPLEFLQSLTTAKCEPLKFKLPFVHNEVVLPCMKPIYKKHFGVFFELWQMLTTGLISYNVCLNFYKKVKDLQNPNNDKIEVLNL